MLHRGLVAGISAIALGIGLAAQPAASAAPNTASADALAISAHWTAERMAAATPRDLHVTTASASRASAAAPAAVSTASTGTTDRRSVVTGLAPWTGRGDLRTAIGRLYFEMTFDGVRYGFVCSGTVVKDTARNASVILTAAHCVYDDASGAFAENVMFIPNQSASGPTDLNCRNDIYGCWLPTAAAVDPQWDAVEWPDNLAFDYGFYLVPTSGRHVQGARQASDSLENAVRPLGIDWRAGKNRTTLKSTYAFGYPFDQDPQLMYCADGLGTIDGIANYTNWWLASCALGEGSSGGPWLQPEESRLEGDEQVFSLNSWGQDVGPGMAGPVLQDPARGTGRPHALFNRLGNPVSSSDALIGPVNSRF